MKISYDTKTDLLYIRLDEKKQRVINKKVTDTMVLDIGKNNKIVGIEIMDASKSVAMDRLLPVSQEVA